MSTFLTPYSRFFSSKISSRLCSNDIFRSKLETQFLININVTKEIPTVEIGYLDEKYNLIEDKIAQCKIDREYKTNSFLFYPYKKSLENEKGILINADTNKESKKNTFFDLN